MNDNDQSILDVWLSGDGNVRSVKLGDRLALEDSATVEWERDEDFFDRCHGIVTCTFTIVGEVVALPFRILGGVFRFIY